MAEDKTPQAEEAGRLRHRAEVKAARIPKIEEALPAEQANRLFHELQVHQIELELQNEELRRAQAELEASRERYFDLYDLAPVGYCTLSEKGLILEANLTAARLLCLDRNALPGQPFTRFIHREDQDSYYRYCRLLRESNGPQRCELRMLNNHSTLFWVLLESSLTRNDGGITVWRAVMTDISALKKAAEALQLAFDQIKTLRGIVPICMKCKKIRDDQGFWSQVEVYVTSHSEAEFSHGLCPECVKVLYPDFNPGGKPDKQ